MTNLHQAAQKIPKNPFQERLYNTHGQKNMDYGMVCRVISKAEGGPAAIL